MKEEFSHLRPVQILGRIWRDCISCCNCRSRLQKQEKRRRNFRNCSQISINLSTRTRWKAFAHDRLCPFLKMIRQQAQHHILVHVGIIVDLNENSILFSRVFGRDLSKTHQAERL